MIRHYVADLHVHSLLSPCAAVEMTPRNIVWHAAERGVDILAITDYNAGDNVRAAMEAAKGTSVTVLPGMEVETKEEVHFIALFGKMRTFMEWQRTVDAHRSGRKNDAVKFGAQFVVDAEDNLICEKEDMLLESLTLTIKEACGIVAELGGLAIASHVDRPAYSLLSQLGFIPPGLKLSAVEISPLLKRDEAVRKFPLLKGWPLVTNSDAHTIDDFVDGPKTTFALAEPTLAEIRQAINCENSRRVVV